MWYRNTPTCLWSLTLTELSRAPLRALADILRCNPKEADSFSSNALGTVKHSIDLPCNVMCPSKHGQKASCDQWFAYWCHRYGTKSMTAFHLFWSSRAKPATDPILLTDQHSGCPGKLGHSLQLSAVHLFRAGHLAALLQWDHGMALKRAGCLLQASKYNVSVKSLLPKHSQQCCRVQSKARKDIFVKLTERKVTTAEQQALTCGRSGLPGCVHLSSSPA